MKIATRCLPLGALPYKNVRSATAMMAKLFSNFPFIPLLPNISNTETLIHRTFEKIPGIEYKDNNLYLKAGTEQYENRIANLDRMFNGSDLTNIGQYSFDAVFLEKYFQIIKKFNSQNACINILGPFTVSQILTLTAKNQMLADKSYRKLFIQAVCIKALWLINEIKKINPDTVPVVILEEPMLGQFGVIKKTTDEITSDIVINMYSKVSEKLKEAGAIVGVQCLEKCDWSLPIKGGVDLISYDAYNNPNNLCIIPEIISDFLEKGGIINWGIVPVVSDKIIKDLTIDYISKRLTSTMGGLILSGVPAKLVFESAMVSVNGDMENLQIMFAEKAHIVATKLGFKYSHA